MKNARIFFSLPLILISIISNGQSGKLKDYLNVPGPIVFDTKSYDLSWSSHPASNFYKQEYIVRGDNADRFDTMILMDLLTGNKTIKEVAEAKVAELKIARQTNPAVTYEISNTKEGEYILDFVMTANGPDGKINIAERNVYRYTYFKTASGNQGILLFGVSTRGYDKNAVPFISNLKLTRQELVNKVKQFKIPVVKI